MPVAFGQNDAAKFINLAVDYANVGLINVVGWYQLDDTSLIPIVDRRVDPRFGFRGNGRINIHGYDLAGLPGGVFAGVVVIVPVNRLGHDFGQFIRVLILLNQVVRGKW